MKRFQTLGLLAVVYRSRDSSGDNSEQGGQAPVWLARREGADVQATLPSISWRAGSAEYRPHLRHYYGDIPDNAKTIINDFFTNLSPSGQYSVNLQTYYNAQMIRHISGRCILFQPPTPITMTTHRVGTRWQH
jgi:hypothetical protein